MYNEDLKILCNIVEHIFKDAAGFLKNSIVTQKLLNQTLFVNLVNQGHSHAACFSTIKTQGLYLSNWADDLPIEKDFCLHIFEGYNWYRCQSFSNSLNYGHTVLSEIDTNIVLQKFFCTVCNFGTPGRSKIFVDCRSSIADCRLERSLFDLFPVGG